MPGSAINDRSDNGIEITAHIIRVPQEKRGSHSRLGKVFKEVDAHYLLPG